jgi:hypothetical protein
MFKADEEVRLRKMATQVVAQAGLQAVAPLVAVLEDEDEQAVRSAALTLTMLADQFEVYIVCPGVPPTMLADQIESPKEGLVAAMEAKLEPAVLKLESLYHQFSRRPKLAYLFLEALLAIAPFSDKADAAVKKVLAKASPEAHFDICNRIRKRRVKKSEPESPPPPSEVKIKELFASLPTGPRARLEAVPALYSAIRKVAAQELQPAVAAIVEQAAATEYDQMVALSQIANEAMRTAQVGIRDPETGLPASLLPRRPRPSSSARHLHLRDTRAGDDGRQNTLRVDQLPPGSTITLMPTAPEAEPARTTDHQPSAGRGR